MPYRTGILIRRKNITAFLQHIPRMNYLFQRMSFFRIHDNIQHEIHERCIKMKKLINLNYNLKLFPEGVYMDG